MFDRCHAINLPAPLQDRLDAIAGRLMTPAGATVDFSQPKGEAALVAADSVSWRVFKNPVSLFIAGITAVLLELAEPKVRDGVWQNSSFRTDALKRLQRTGLAAMLTVYGPKSRAEAMIAGVGRMHGRVRGLTSEGEAYQADDPVLLDWVQATASFGFMQAYHTYARKLTAGERDALFAEARPAALLYGATGAPSSQAELDALFAAMGERLAGSPIVFEFLDIMRHVPAMPWAARPLQFMLIKAAVALLPAWIARRIGVDGPQWKLNGLERLAVKAIARASDRLVLKQSPAVQSCRRMGLPDDYLYRQR